VTPGCRTWRYGPGHTRPGWIASESTGLRCVGYEIFVYSLRDRFPIIRRATLTIIHRGQGTAELRGDVEFEGDLRLGVREYLRFDLEPPRILQYSYEVWRGSEELWTGRHGAVSPRFAARLTVVEQR